MTPLLWHKWTHLVEIKGCSLASFSFDFFLFYFKIEKQLILLNECSVAMTSLQTNTKPSSSFFSGCCFLNKYLIVFVFFLLCPAPPSQADTKSLQLLPKSQRHYCTSSCPHIIPLPDVPRCATVPPISLQDSAAHSCRQQISPKESQSLWDQSLKGRIPTLPPRTEGSILLAAKPDLQPELKLLPAASVSQADEADWTYISSPLRDVATCAELIFMKYTED